MAVLESLLCGLSAERALERTVGHDEVSVCVFIESILFSSKLLGKDNRTSRNHHPPYIHFTLQKTNRDTQDALLHLSRLFRVNVKDLSVAGTKDKRGVTVQRVSLKRGNKTLEEVWKLANGIGGRRSIEGSLRYRGERGVRTADFEYQENSLELGMLEGNAFIITLRLVPNDYRLSQVTLTTGMSKSTLWMCWTWR
jgi:TruD family tRNA pseudouridine synthase